MSGSHPGPRRQNSAVSSASSGGRTIRASSGSGKRRSSPSNPTGLFARLRGLGGGRNPDGGEAGTEDSEGDRESDVPPYLDTQENGLDEDGAGPSDWYHRGSSPNGYGSPLPGWRTASDHPGNAYIEDGQHDYWQQRSLELSPSRPITPPRPPENTDGTPHADQDDLDEYRRRLKDVLSYSSDERADEPAPETTEVHPASSSPIGERAREESYRDVIGEGNSGEEEFGLLDFPVMDDVSDHTISSRSVTIPRRQFEETPSPGKRTSVIHPSVSRLRSHLRTASSSTVQSSQPFRPTHLRTPSLFSQMSVLSDPASPGPAPIAPKSQNSSSAFTFQPLRQVSAHAFARHSGRSSPVIPQANKRTSSFLGRAVEADDINSYGRPSVLDVRGMIAVGTEGGYVLIYGFSQELKHVLGSAHISTTSGSVTSITISADQTYVAVGHASGNIHLWDLAHTSKPARTTLALSLQQVLSGRKEGHIQGSRILHIGFVGTRHTAIVSGDQHGRAFWWSLGRIVGVESNDVVRMLGSYPAPEEPRQTHKRSTLFAVLPLPLGDHPHPTDGIQLTALLTPGKLVVVAMKPSPRTWYRKMRDAGGGLAGCAIWLRSGEVVQEGPSDPVLAFSWDKSVRFLRVRMGKDSNPDFVEGRRWEAPDEVRAMQWFNSNHMLLVTPAEIVLLDVRTMLAVETTPLQTRLLASQDCFAGRHDAVLPGYIGGSVIPFRGKLFLLTQSNVQVGTLLRWNDRILACVHQGDFLGAIHLALAYYNGTAEGNTIGLPEERQSRQEVVGNRVHELIHASLDWAFSEDRMRDDTHYSADGRGVDLTSLFEGLATACVEACVSMDDSTFLFDEAFEHYANVGIQSLFLRILEPYIFDGRIRQTPPKIAQSLIALHDDNGEYDLAEALIWHTDPINLDIDQAVRVCESHGLWDALFHVYTRAIKDYVAPLVKMVGLIRDNRNRPESAIEANKVYAYMEMTLSGASYPSGEMLDCREGLHARDQIYGFVFAGRKVIWPDGPDGHLIEGSLAAYPYLDLLLRFDTEAFLHVMDLAFEDSYLNEAHTVNRQSIINVMLDVMDPMSFHSGDVTLLHIFVARNLPKYPQFLFIPPSTLQRILVSLASDPDQSSREDRELAAEYLLSAYTPHDADAMLEMFETAGFFRILRNAYRRDRRWGPFVGALLADPDADQGVFAEVHDLQSLTGADLSRTIAGFLPSLFDLSVPATAQLIDQDFPALHPGALDLLALHPHKQLAYLRSLLDADGSPKLDLSARHLYVSLLFRLDPEAVFPVLERWAADLDLSRLAAECRTGGHFEGEIWALDRQGKTKETFEAIAEVLGRGTNLDDGAPTMQTILSVGRLAIRLCQERAPADAEDRWFGVLHEFVELITLDESDTLSEALRSLIKESLTLLMAAPISFPRLFKRLVEASTLTKARKGRAYAEFRTILTGMLDSYRAEGEMLTMTTRLVEADLHEAVQDLVNRRQRGWRPSQAACDRCAKGLDGEMAVLRSGQILHASCST